MLGGVGGGSRKATSYPDYRLGPNQEAGRRPSRRDVQFACPTRAVCDTAISLTHVR